MLRPKKNSKKEKVKLTRDSYRKAKGFLHYLKPYRVLYFIGWIFLVLSTTTGLLFPLFMGNLLGSGTGSPGSMADILKSIHIENINQVAFGLFILFFAQSLFSYFRVVIFTNVTENALRDLRKHAFERLIYMPMDFFNRHKVGELTSRVSSDITQIQETLRTTIAEFFRQLIIVVGGITFLFFLSWKLALIMLATVPVMAIIAVFFGRFIRRLSKNAQDHTAQANSIIEEALMGISNVKSFTNELFILGRYRSSVDEIRNMNVKAGVWRGLFVSFVIFCLFGAIVFIIWKGLLMTQGVNPELSSSGFFSFILYTMMMGASIGALPDLYSAIQKSIGSTENLMDMINESTERDLHRGTDKPEIRGNVSFKDVTFSYPQRPDIPVLQSISFSCNPDETVAIVGSSGAGKTTISALLLNYYSINSGQILFDETPIDKIDQQWLRENIAYVPQEVLLFAGTIRENIAFGQTGASEEQIRNAAEKANALQFIESFPNGFDTQVGDRGIQLSGGQKQRIAIARAILKNPRILILDEATSALDSESEKVVQDALEKLMLGRTSFVIAHRLSTIRKADKILVLENGRIAETGKHEALLEENGIYARLIQLQHTVN